MKIDDGPEIELRQKQSYDGLNRADGVFYVSMPGDEGNRLAAELRSCLPDVGVIRADPANGAASSSGHPFCRRDRRDAAIIEAPPGGLTASDLLVPAGLRSTVCFLMVMRPSESAEPDAHRETADRPRVLVVVDERQVRVMLARGLERAGYRVVEASSAEQAVHLLQTTPIEAAILDVRLSGPTSGLDVLAELRRQPDMAHTPALVLTGGTLDDDEQRTVMKHRAFLFYKLEGINTMLDFLSQLTGHRPAR